METLTNSWQTKKGYFFISIYFSNDLPVFVITSNTHGNRKFSLFQAK